MSTTITPASPLSSEYDEHGFVHFEGLLTAEEIPEIRDVFMEQVERDRSVGYDDNLPSDDVLSGIRGSSTRTAAPTSRSAASHADGCSTRASSDRSIEMMGPAYAAQSMFYFKPPTARGQALHQDNIFLQAHPETCIAAWIAIDDCDGENGGLGGAGIPPLRDRLPG